MNATGGTKGESATCLGTSSFPARIPELDGVRGSAVLALVLWHYIPSIADHTPGSWPAYLGRAFSFCWSGVDLLFVLFGFLVGSSLWRERFSPRYFTTFYARRAAHILPVYFFMLGVFVAGDFSLRFGMPAAAQPLFQNNLPWWSYPIFLQNLFMPGIDDLGPKVIQTAWALVVASQFCLLLPVLIHALPPRRLGWALVLLALQAPLLRAWVGGGVATYVLLPFRLDSLLAGVLLALMWNNEPGHGWFAHRQRWLKGLWFLLALPAIELVRGGAGLFTLHLTYGWIANFWLAIWFALTLALILNGHWWANAIFRLRPLQWMGRVAYSLFFLHTPILGLVHLIIRRQEPVLRDGRTAAVTALALVLSLLAAAASYRWIERPFLTLGKRFKY
jgi:peptidoglycan/LPS O-acetylase OafA/YrhL